MESEIESEPADLPESMHHRRHAILSGLQSTSVDREMEERVGSHREGKKNY